MIRPLKILISVLGAVIIFVGGWGFISWWSVKGVETPQYTFIVENKGYEIRDYPGYISIETRTKGDHEKAIADGFAVLYKYLAEHDIPMTAPIYDIAIGEVGDTHDISLAAPRELMVETPATSTGVRIHNMQERRMAVLIFTGKPTVARIAQEKRKLARLLIRDGVVALSDFVVARYNPPFTIPFMMKNEIQVMI